jgi:hypothetical protein
MRHSSFSKRSDGIPDTCVCAHRFSAAVTTCCRGITLALAFASAECVDQVTPPEDIQQGGQILSSSFEADGSPTLDGWLAGDPTHTSVVRDAPAGGGSWAAKLVSNGSPTTAYLYVPMTRLRTGDTVRVSCFVKAFDQAGGGAVELRVGSSLDSPWRKKVVSYDTLWAEVSLTDTVGLEPGQVVWLVLSSLHSEVIPRQGLFDLVSVTRSP